jgi:HK97 family phage prohead protease
MVSDDGVFSGYASVFGVADDYGSMMMPGAFAKTLQERGAKIKILRNHAILIGSPLSMVEDERGLFVTGRINLGTQAGAEAFALMKAGDLDGMSIAFTAMKETKSKDGVREIREVKLYEFGPVDFPANESALITDVRQMDQRMADLESEERATDFGQTVDEQALRAGHYRLRSALDTTLSCIWWESDGGDVVGLIDSAIADFHAAYLEWANAFIAAGMSEDFYLSANPIEAETRSWMAGRTPDAMAAETTFTADEIRALLKGATIDLRNRQSDIPEPLRLAHSKQRNAQAAELFSALRSTFSPAEKRRMMALLQSADEPRQLDLGDIRTALSNFQTTIGAIQS